MILLLQLGLRLVREWQTLLLGLIVFGMFGWILLALSAK